MLLSIKPGVDSRSRGCYAILKETYHHGSSPVVLIRPCQSHNSSRQNQDNTKRPGNHIEWNISNKQHNSQNHPEHSKYTKSENTIALNTHRPLPPSSTQ